MNVHKINMQGIGVDGYMCAPVNMGTLRNLALLLSKGGIVDVDAARSMSATLDIMEESPYSIVGIALSAEAMFAIRHYLRFLLKLEGAQGAVHTIGAMLGISTDVQTYTVSDESLWAIERLAKGLRELKEDPADVGAALQQLVKEMREGEA